MQNENNLNSHRFPIAIDMQGTALDFAIAYNLFSFQHIWTVLEAWLNCYKR